MGTVTEPRAAPLRPMGVAEILDGAVRLVRRNARAALTISAPFAVVRAVVNALISYATVNSGGAAVLATIGSLLLAILFGTVLTGLLAPVYSRDLLGSRMPAGGAVRGVGVRGGALLVALGVIETVAQGAGLAAFAVGGVWLWGVWAVAAPALVLEHTGVRGALGRSVALVRGLFWRTWGIRALGWLLVSVLGFVIALPFQVVASFVVDYNPFSSSHSVGNPGLYVLLLSLGGVIVALLLPPVSAAIDLLLYTDLRMRKEGMDILLGLPAEPAGEPPAMSAW
jgi:hypothetical protein